MADHTPVTSAAPALILQPIVHVENMSASVTFYENLGGSIIHGSRDADWVLMQLGTAQVGLIVQAPNLELGEGTVELNFFSPMPLDEYEQQLRGSKVPIINVGADVTYGPQLQVRSPDGLLIKINQVEPDPYL